MLQKINNLNGFEFEFLKYVKSVGKLFYSLASKQTFSDKIEWKISTLYNLNKNSQ